MVRDGDFDLYWCLFSLQRYPEEAVLRNRYFQWRTLPPPGQQNLIGHDHDKRHTIP